MNERPKKVFISYCHQNSEVCGRIAGLLSRNPELSVWYDKGLIAGEEYRRRIAETIRETDYFIVLLSEASVCSEWVLDEVEYAKKLRKKILPVWIEKAELPGNLEMLLHRYHSLFWYLRTSDSQFERELYASVLRRPAENEGKALVGNGNEFSESENQQMRKLLEEEARENYSSCYGAENACLLGKAYLFGGPCAVNRDAARSYFTVAEYFGNMDGSFYLLRMKLEDHMENTWDVPEESVSQPIVREIGQLSDKGSIPAMLFMGDVYWYGKYGYPQDAEKSAALYEVCARGGNARAQYIMSANYYFGDGVPQNYILARMYANLAVEQRYVKSWRRWGKFYRDGLAVQQDYAKARECYEKGALMGDFNCYNKIGDMLYYGWGFPVDYKEAFQYYLKGEAAPAFGHKYSLYKAKEALGRCYELGHGVEKDLLKAAEKYLEGYRYGNEECRKGYIRCRDLSPQPEESL